MHAMHAIYVPADCFFFPVVSAPTSCPFLRDTHSGFVGCICAPTSAFVLFPFHSKATKLLPKLPRGSGTVGVVLALRGLGAAKLTPVASNSSCRTRRHSRASTANRRGKLVLLYRARASGSRTPVLTVNGRPQPEPEPGKAARQYRLFVECMSRLRADPLTSQQASGQPIGSSCGLEGMVARIAPLFQHEQSLIRWVAFRGAVTSLFINIFDTSNPVAASPQELELAMGLEWVTDSAGSRRVEVAAGFGDALALDCIAWSATALLRLGTGPGPRVLIMAPEPDALPQPGWYPEPLWGKAERYWDGSDWMAACRVRNGRSYTETTMPLRQWSCPCIRRW
jgi:hypothetical protein